MSVGRKRHFDRFLNFSTVRSAAVLSLLSAVQTMSASAQTAANAGTMPRDVAREQVLLQQVSIPEGFKATLFAAPPIAMYPVCLTATVRGEVYACIDPNLSLTATKGRGKVVRLVDDNGDGVADRYSVFAQMDSPRGLAHDGRTLYVMHPPNLTAYRDTTGDGIADVSEDIVTGLGFDLDFRGADHTTNGITLGIDGYIYIAVGDYGYRKAVGKDGTTISHRGGGVVRVRTDGTGLELFAEGTRNIYDVAVDPMLRVFTRDNTNDGDGWDIRLHYLPPGAHMGYPMYYKNFSGEHMQSLADYGAGSGTGGLYVHDPGFPKGFGDNLYTADWLTNQVTRHPLEKKGASFGVTQEKFVGVPHPVDMAMDGQSNMFVASLYGGNYTYEGDTVGYIVRLTPERATTPKAVDIASLNDAGLRTQLVSGNAEYRLQAQREILRRGNKPAVVTALNALVLNKALATEARIAAMFTLAQLAGDRARTTLTAATNDAALRALAYRALTDNKSSAARLSPALFVKGLADANPSIQVEALNALVRINATASAGAIVPLTGSADATVAHLAVNALVALKGSAAALSALPTATGSARVGVLRALERMHDTAVVNALVRIQTSATTPQPDILEALARLYFREAEWDGSWWGTRPNFLGPYFLAAEWPGSRLTRAALVAGANAANADRAAILKDYERNRILPAGASGILINEKDAEHRRAVMETLLGLSQLTANKMVTVQDLYDLADAAEKIPMAQMFSLQASLPTEPAPVPANAAPGARPPAPVVDPIAIRLGRTIALNAALPDSIRARAVTLIGTVPGRTGLETSADVLSKINPAITPAGTTAGPLEASWRRYVGDRRRLQELDWFVDLSRSADSSARTLAFAVLLQSVRGGRAAPAVNDKVQPVLTAAWTSQAAASDLVRAVGIMRLESAYTQQLEAHRARSGVPARDRTSGSSTSGMTWQPLFNGRDLKDWDIKFAQHPLGENFRNTFRVEDGMLKVRYDGWDDFKGEFGHIFYKQPFSHYIVAVEYRFVGDQVKGAGAGNSWAIRNNGIMVQSQSAASMGMNQDFPISLEVQLLGGLGSGTRTTANLCTPGTHVVMNEKLVTAHCTNSASVTYNGDQWVRVEAMVLGDSVVKHIVNGDTVMVYSKPQMGGGQANNTNPGVLENGKLLKEGYITLQAETAPIDFRKVELVNLVGCMDPKDANYKSYFVKSNPAACKKR
ncbi:MAG: DUF7133 domain-containing protein [Gemmatimonas sp.]